MSLVFPIRSGQTQTGLYNHRRWLEALNLGTIFLYYLCSLFMLCTCIYVLFNLFVITCFCFINNILMALSLLYTYISYYPIATFQKAGTCLDAQKSMAKQPIKGCVSNQNRTCGKSVSEKLE